VPTIEQCERNPKQKDNERKAQSAETLIEVMSVSAAARPPEAKESPVAQKPVEQLLSIQASPKWAEEIIRCGLTKIRTSVIISA
jgi:hypothetical protein